LLYKTVRSTFTERGAGVYRAKRNKYNCFIKQ
jgi:hypothetical protein